MPARTIKKAVSADPGGGRGLVQVVAMLDKQRADAVAEGRFCRLSRSAMDFIIGYGMDDAGSTALPISGAG